MRITFILSSLRLSGGVRVVIEYANRLAGRGHQVYLVAPLASIDDEMRSVLSEKVTIRQSRVARSQKSSWVNLLALSWSLARSVPASDIILSTHTPTTLVSFIAGKILHRGKLVWFFQDYGVMFEDRPLEAWLMRNATLWHPLVVTISKFCRQDLLQYRDAEIVVTGEALSDPEIFQPVFSSQRPKHSEKAIFFLGDLRPRKGLQDFLAAATIVYKKMPAIKLWVAMKDAADLASDLPIQVFERPTREQLIDLYTGCDLYVSASWCEGFGLPPLEAMACATPVVLTDSGGVREYAEDRVNCLLVPPRQPEMLADAMLRVLEDEQLAEKLSQNALKTAQRFEWNTVIDRLENALVGWNKSR